MFGVDVGQIIEGHYNEVTKQENDLYNYRIEICKQCPLYTEKELIGPICDSKKYYNPKTKELSDLPEPDFISGCGCRLQAALRVPNKKCKLEKF